MVIFYQTLCLMFKLLLTSLLIFGPFFHCETTHMSSQPTVDPIFQPVSNNSHGKIQVALLLDTSNSMDGLIDQARAQLWKMVNRLASAKKNQEIADLEIALFEYGNSGLEAEKGYIRMVQPLGRDLDGLSEKLFELRTNGGDEYCGWVIGDATKLLPWSDEPGDLKIIVIAGNEPFDQGKVNFRRTCAAAMEKGIIVNTIHCGDYETGEKTFWREGATIGNGRYMNINTDEKVVHIPTPYDARMMELNSKLNDTYIGYGSLGEERKMRQEAQDKNAATYGSANVAQRAASKSKASYSNSEWDLVDAEAADKDLVSKLKKDELPKQLQGKSEAEVRQEIARLRSDRESIRKEIADLEKKMDDFIAEESKKQSATQTLDQVLIQTVVDQAKGKGFEL